MISLDKTELVNTIKVTVTETSKLSDPLFYMVLDYPFLNSMYLIDLGENISSHKSRYDKFEIAQQSIADLHPGQYIYRIYEAEEVVDNIGELINLLETGMLEIKGADEPEEGTYDDEDTDDDFLVLD